MNGECVGGQGRGGGHGDIGKGEAKRRRKGRKGGKEERRKGERKEGEALRKEVQYPHWLLLVQSQRQPRYGH